MNSVINIAVFLLPGLVAARLKALLDPYYKDRNRETSELEATIYAILNNLPAIFIGWGIWSGMAHKLLPFKVWAAELIQLPDAVSFFVGSTLLAVLIEWLLKPALMRWVGKKRNAKRATGGLPSFEDAEAWEIFLGSEEELCLRITSLSDGARSHITGILRSASKPDDLLQGVTLEGTDELAVLDQWLYLPLRTYVDARTGFVYELFSKDQLETAKRLQESS